MGFMSELVTLIWLIVEQSAVEQTVQTRCQAQAGHCLESSTGEPAGWAEHSFARDALAYRHLTPQEQSRPGLAAALMSVCIRGRR